MLSLRPSCNGICFSQFEFLKNPIKRASKIDIRLKYFHEFCVSKWLTHKRPEKIIDEKHAVVVLSHISRFCEVILEEDAI